jgi:hypothetical protein
MDELPIFADPANLESLPDPEAIILPDGATSLDFLRAVYRDHRQALSVRLKAAGIACQYEHAKLAYQGRPPGSAGVAVEV